MQFHAIFYQLKKLQISEEVYCIFLELKLIDLNNNKYCIFLLPVLMIVLDPQDFCFLDTDSQKYADPRGKLSTKNCKIFFTLTSKSELLERERL